MRQDGLVFSLHYSRVVLDDPMNPEGYVHEDRKAIRGSAQQAFNEAVEIAEATGMPVVVACRAVNIESTIFPEYLQAGTHPDHLR